MFKVNIIHFDVFVFKFQHISNMFNGKKINKSNFCENKKSFKIDEIDIKKILTSKKEP